MNVHYKDMKYNFITFAFGAFKLKISLSYI